MHLVKVTQQAPTWSIILLLTSGADVFKDRSLEVLISAPRYVCGMKNDARLVHDTLR